MTHPEISVVMAVYNGEKYLKPTIETVLTQTFKDFEFIIVNDGSSDETQNVIEEYHDDRIILINNVQNVGQTASLNIGLQHARGKYIARTDAGDISARERFRKQFLYLEAHPAIDILGTAAFEYDIPGNLCGNVFMSNRPLTIVQKTFFSCPVIHVSVMMHRDRIMELGGYDDAYRILADYGLWARALQHGFRFWNLRDVLTGYLIDPGSFGSEHARGRSIREASQIICDLALKLTGDHLSFDQAEDIYRFFVFGPQDLDMQSMSRTEMLFESILLKLNIPQRDINYLFLRSYIKTLTQSGRASLPFKKNLNQKVIRDMIKRSSGVFSFQVLENLYGSFKSIRRRNYSAAGMNTPVFANPAGK